MRPLEPGSHYSALIDWGDGQTSAGTLTAHGSGGYDVSGTNTYAEEGTYTITVTLLDEGGSSTTATSMATVADAALSDFGTSFSGTTGLAVTDIPVAFFTDAGGPEPVGNYTVSIDWGDGTNPDPTGNISVSGSLFSVAGTHTYTTSGAFTVSVTIQDDGGSSITSTTNAMISDGGGGAVGG